VTEHYDAIIVGSGAGGGTLAHTLARSGKRILLGNIQMCGKSNAEAMKGEEPKLTMLAPLGMAEHHVLDENSYLSMDIPVAGVAHQAGTCRFGDDPASFFPSIGAVNPTLTAIANAIRVGEHLLSRMS
jgi:choline dehydrogenase-like flavoprotein